MDVPAENKSIWPTGGLTLLSPFISTNNNLFVCKEIYMNSLKNKLSKTLDSYLYDINFIEHNHDPSTLIYKVKTVKVIAYSHPSWHSSTISMA